MGITLLLGAVSLILCYGASPARAEGTAHDWPGASHANDQCIKLAKTKAVLRDVEGNPLRDAETSEIKISGNTKSETCKAAGVSGVQITGIESIKTGSGLTLYYSWSGLSNTSQESGFIASTELASTPTSVRKDSGESPETHELNGEPASLSTGEPHYRILSRAIPGAQGYFGGSNWYTYSPYGLPGCCDSHFSLMTWSWIDVSGGGITRANVTEGATFYPSTVPAKRLTSYNTSHEANGEVTAVYGKVSSGSQSVWGWMVARANYSTSGSESGCRNHMEYVGGGTPVEGLLCPIIEPVPHGTATPIVTPAGELLVMAADTNHELLSFARTSGGEWKVFNVTANVSGAPTIEGEPVPIVIPNGELLVMAVDTNKELLSFSRTSTGEWKIFNVTGSVSGAPTVTGPADPIVTPSGELLVFAGDTNKELLSFSRSSTGEWKVFNVTANVAGNPDITGAPTPIITPTDELLVFAADTNKELVSFYRSSGGEWKVFNVTANVAGNPDIAGTPTPIVTPTGELLVMVSDTNKEMVSFYRTSGGEWKVFNITAVVSGNPDITGSPNPIVTPSGELLVFAPDTNSELISFYRTAGGEWRVFNVTAVVPGNPPIEGIPVPITPTGELLVMAPDTNHELVNFYRSSGGEWKIFNVTAAVPGSPLI